VQARASFHRASFALRHGLAGHDLFTLPRLVELAKSMPRDRIEINSGKLEPGIRPEDVPGIDLSADEVIRRIENAAAWLVVKGVELNPAYRALLHDFLTEVSTAAGPGTSMPRRTSWSRSAATNSSMSSTMPTAGSCPRKGSSCRRPDTAINPIE